MQKPTYQRHSSYPHDIGRHLKQSCIISPELYALIKRMREQWIPGPFSDFSNGPGYEATRNHTFTSPSQAVVSQATPFAERKGLVTLQPLSCPHGRNLM